MVSLGRKGIDQMTNEIRIVLNQVGAFIELHRSENQNPVVLLGKLSNNLMDKYRSELIERNPYMEYASIGQIIQGVAQWWFDAVKKQIPGVTLNPVLWSYNASDNTYSKA
jgi:hypothetical protein